MTDSPTDISFMQRALDVAMPARGLVEPNPMVGCVITKNGRMLASARHERFGQPHAEANALAACDFAPTGATAYVTLEPCCHENKQTPPCLPRLLQAGLARVVIGCLDPNPAVNGASARALRAAGVRVDVGILEPAARQLIAPFTARMRDHRPYVTLKWAQSADAKIAGPGGRRARITNAHSHRVAHELRARCDAILVGINTVLADNPLLTTRDVPMIRPLLRVVLDRDLRTPPSSRLAQSVAAGRVLIFCSPQAPGAGALESLGLEIRRIDTAAAGRLSLPAVLAALHEQNVTHLLVEPGPALARSFLSENISDRVWVFESANAIADPTAPSALAVPYPAVGHLDLSGDRLTEHLNPVSSVFFAPLPTPDLLLAASSTAEKGMFATDGHR